MPPTNASFSTLLTGYTTAETLRQMAWLQYFLVSAPISKVKNVNSPSHASKAPVEKRQGDLCEVVRVGHGHALWQDLTKPTDDDGVPVSESFLSAQQMRPPRQLHQSDRDRGLGSSDTFQATRFVANMA